ncbi:MAG TPA: oxidoreductase [Candidatus Andersenbacteria bacterium]|nr:oxidoreductase [Candidatus Andersenbacteria bacterium]
MFIDALLNKITMYRLTLYYLIALLVFAGIFGMFGLLPYSLLDISLSVLIAICVSLVANLGFAKFFHAATNIESVFITALIIVCLIPISFPANALFLAAACIFAMGSKYLLTIEKQHIFNPAAVGVLGISLLSPEHVAIWWMGTPLMMPFVILGGVLLVRRIRRESMVYVFFAIYFLVSIITFIIQGNLFSSFSSIFDILLFRSPVWFLGMVMLTEPLTAPGRKRPQLLYASLVVLCTATQQIRFSPIHFTPEEALCIGNIAAYIMTPRHRFVLALQEKIQLTADTIQYIFQPKQPLAFKAGQYMEWTLPHSGTDSRGNRRYFSIVSAPKADKLSIAVKFYENSSSYKTKLKNLEVGEEIIAAQLGGDFTLPRTIENKKLVCIAGGIGITPYISMIEYIMREKKSCDIVLLYSLKTLNDAVFIDTLEKARAFGINTVYTITDKNSIPKDWEWGVGIIDAAMIQKEIPDYSERTFYISGPQLMVQALESMLKHINISKKKIITDYFPGFAG